MKVLKPARTTPSKASFKQISQKARLNFFVSFNSLKRFFLKARKALLTVRVDWEGDGAGSDDDDDDDEDGDGDEDGAFSLSPSLFLRSRFAFLQVRSFFGKQEVKMPTNKATKLANRKPIHQSPTQFGCAGVKPGDGRRMMVISCNVS